MKKWNLSMSGLGSRGVDALIMEAMKKLRLPDDIICLFSLNCFWHNE
jgi:hypothetical protein